MPLPARSTSGITLKHCRIGEKFLRWSDTNPTAHQILGNVSLYYLTRTFPTSLYHYWASTGSRHFHTESQPNLAKIKATGKPIGYSLFKKEITPFLPEWAEGEVNLVWSKKHEKVRRSLVHDLPDPREKWLTDQGGHFAALEQPEQLWQDLHDFLGVAWKKA